MGEHVSRIIKAMRGWDEGLSSYSQQPSGMFGRVAIVKCGNVVLNSEDLDLEFVVPFD